MKYIIGIGTNIGDRKENIENAIEAFTLIPKCEILRCSEIYETEPVGYEEQQPFYNACIELESTLEPNEILGVCLGIEAGMGRVREIKNGPRIIDLDVILAEDKSVDTQNLTVPHPRYTERRFVMIPMLDLFPDGTAYGIEFSRHLLGIKGQKIIQL